ncbi:hypothetical protein [Streptomyces antarcticus]|uniref:hypothetical protein n=1 Tax=Streptomyces antarcticus TaxID=2996458 RepID=UPI002271E70D|nr:MULTISPECIES: hypothetical protein [unclassified Streptomyces]MCY0943832.1 hypothetical protein [Streptomyces sp. H34-AA3]MCY0954637.1 hypothetical protein [Streptomyces sp. H27-S2]MCZ4085710.1 hypothetical protein [Streptomyces sp. H34-S5]
MLCTAALDGIALDRVEVRVRARNNDARFFEVPSEAPAVPYDLTAADERCPMLRMVRSQHGIELHAVAPDRPPPSGPPTESTASLGQWAGHRCSLYGTPAAM